MLRPEGYLFDEVTFLLRSELTSPATYNSILAAVAAGSTKVGDIALAVGVDSPTAGKYLHVLRELRLVAREIPVTDPNPLRSRRGRYRIADRFVAFHFRHLQPNLSLVHAGRGAKVLEEFIAPDLERLFDEARLDLVLAHLRREAGEVLGDEVLEAGRYDGRFVRAVARTVSGQTVAAIVVPEEVPVEVHVPTPGEILGGRMLDHAGLGGAAQVVLLFAATPFVGEGVQWVLELIGVG